MSAHAPIRLLSLLLTLSGLFSPVAAAEDAPAIAQEIAMAITQAVNDASAELDSLTSTARSRAAGLISQLHGIRSDLQSKASTVASETSTFQSLMNAVSWRQSEAESAVKRANRALATWEAKHRGLLQEARRIDAAIIAHNGRKGQARTAAEIAAYNAEAKRLNARRSQVNGTIGSHLAAKGRDVLPLRHDASRKIQLHQDKVSEAKRKEIEINAMIDELKSLSLRAGGLVQDLITTVNNGRAGTPAPPTPPAPGPRGKGGASEGRATGKAPPRPRSKPMVPVGGDGRESPPDTTWRPARATPKVVPEAKPIDAGPTDSTSLVRGPRSGDLRPVPREEGDTSTPLLSASQFASLQAERTRVVRRIALMKQVLERTRGDAAKTAIARAQFEELGQEATQDALLQLLGVIGYLKPLDRLRRIPGAKEILTGARKNAIEAALASAEALLQHDKAGTEKKSLDALAAEQQAVAAGQTALATVLLRLDTLADRRTKRELEAVQKVLSMGLRTAKFVDTRVEARDPMDWKSYATDFAEFAADVGGAFHPGLAGGRLAIEGMERLGKHLVALRGIEQLGKALAAHDMALLVNGARLRQAEQRLAEIDRLLKLRTLMK